MENYELIKEDLGTGKRGNYQKFRDIWTCFSCEAYTKWKVDGMEADQLRSYEGQGEIIANQ